MRKYPTKFTPLRKDLYDSFPKFMYCIWPGFGILIPATRIQLDIAKWLSESYINSDKITEKNIIMAFRSCGKTQILQAYILWRLRRDPDLKVLVSSKSEDIAKKFTSNCLKVILSDALDSHLLGCLVPDKRKRQRNSERMFDVGATSRKEHSPSVYCRGIKSDVSGNRADIIVADDVEDLEAESTKERQEILRRFYALIPLIGSVDLIKEKRAHIICLGTPYHNDSIYEVLQTSNDFSCRRWTFEYPETISQYGNTLAPIITNNINNKTIGTAVDSQRFTQKDVEEKRKDTTDVFYRQQYMLDSTLADEDKFPLTCKNIIVTNYGDGKAPDVLIRGRTKEVEGVDCVGLRNDGWYWNANDNLNYENFEGSYMAIDTCYFERGSDALYAIIVSILNGKFFIRKLYCDLDGMTDKVINDLINLAINYRVLNIFIEDRDGSSANIFRNLMSTSYSCAVTGIQNFQRKEKRILNVLEPIISNGLLVVSPDIIREDRNNGLKCFNHSRHKGSRLDYELFFQLTHLSQDEKCLVHDDGIDALAILFKELEKFTGINQYTSANQKRKKKRKHYIDEQFDLMTKEDNKKKRPEELPEIIDLSQGNPHNPIENKYAKSRSQRIKELNFFS